MSTDPIDTPDVASSSMAKQLLAEAGMAGTVDSPDSLVMEISEIVRNAYGLPSIADRVIAVATHLSQLISHPTGNRLAEIYVRVQRFLHSYKGLETRLLKEDCGAAPTWFQSVASYELNHPVPSDDVALEALFIGLDARVPLSGISGTWGDVTVYLWRNAQLPVLNAENAHRVQESELMEQLCESYVRKTAQTRIDGDALLGPRTRKSDLQRWWFESQVRFNVPCSWLTWRPYRLLWGRTADGSWQFGHYEWDVGRMGPLTIRAYAKVIQGVWSACDWCSPMIAGIKFG